MFSKIEHLGIAVKDATATAAVFAKLFHTQPYKSEVVESESVNTVFFQIGPNKIELLESTDSTSAISKFIEKKGEGIHHIAFEVNDLESEMKRLKSEGFIFINESPKIGADNKLIAFIHPKSAGGVLIELCQEIR